MANLAIVGSHSVNGVARIHSELLRTRVVADFADMYPQRFNNKTNGVTPRRWLFMANSEFSGLITEAIGDGWITDLSQLRDLLPPGGRSRFSRPRSPDKTDRQRALCRLAQRHHRSGRRPGDHLRQPDQTHP